jgi:hypothetical protein
VPQAVFKDKFDSDRIRRSRVGWPFVLLLAAFCALIVA